jgi:ribulose-phosphate 3-epimerase
VWSQKESFLALDIGADSVRGFGLANAGSVRTGLVAERGGSMSENIAGAVDALETELGVKFKSAFITGNFGIVRSFFGKNTICFPRLRKLSDLDVRNAIFNSPELRDAEQTTLHLIPLQFIIDGSRDVRDTSGAMCRSLSVRFNSISYPGAAFDEIKKGLLGACLPAEGFFDPIYLLGMAHYDKRSKKPALFIDFGKTKTLAGVFRERGMVSRFDLEIGQDEISKRLSEEFDIGLKEAEEIKLSVLSGPPMPSDQYVLADERFPDITRFDVREAWFGVNDYIIDRAFGKIKDEDYDLFITGAGTNPDNIKSLILRNKGLENIAVLSEFAAAGAFGEMFRKGIKMKKRKKIKIRGAVPIIPSVMEWNISGGYVYEMFESMRIQAVHFDMMDGFYTEKVSGTLDDLEKIRKHTRLKIHTHLMVENPMMWIEPAARAGSDSLMVSTGTRRIVESLKKIKDLKKRCGLALHPDFDLKNLKPEILTMLDDVMVMAVRPGASGQEFLPKALPRIKTLDKTRKKYGFKYKIIVDGGINPNTAKECWKAGADFLVSGSFLRKAPDFADAVAKLLP